jgi:hypothetical protein
MRAVKPSMPFDVNAKTVPHEFQMGITDVLCDMDHAGAIQHIQIFTHQNHIACWFSGLDLLQSHEQSFEESALGCFLLEWYFIIK